MSESDRMKELAGLVLSKEHQTTITEATRKSNGRGPHDPNIFAQHDKENEDRAARKKIEQQTTEFAQRVKDIEQIASKAKSMGTKGHIKPAVKLLGRIEQIIKDIKKDFN